MKSKLNYIKWTFEIMSRSERFQFIVGGWFAAVLFINGFLWLVFDEVPGRYVGGMGLLLGAIVYVEDRMMPLVMRLHRMRAIARKIINNPFMLPPDR